jgi:non-specific serine/threonine protein kinase
MSLTLQRAPHYRRVLADRRAHHRGQPPHSPHDVDLPHELNSFVGGRGQISSVITELCAARVLTLTGSGGIGKTRLALQVARAVHAEYERCSWVPLGATVNTVDIADVIGAALGAGRASNAMDAETLIAGIGNHRVLLVLDNCEHLIAACADLVMRLLQACPGVRIIATSREPLGVPGEVVYPVEPLSWPKENESLEQQMQSAAVCLFLERARARGARLKLSEETCMNVAAICRTLAGVPLAIELAATRTSSMTVAELVARLNVDALGALSVGARALPPRQQSLRGSLDWSHALLVAAEQRLLRRLALFVADFTVDDAVVAYASDDLDDQDVAVLLDRLVAQSLVQATERDSRMWFSLAAHVRAYALERLTEAGEVGRSTGGQTNVEPALVAEADVAAQPLEDGARTRERGPRDSPAKISRQRPRGLSERERDVVVLIASGRSNRQIADELVITKKTAEAHVSHILTKLGLCSRVQIATWCLQQGLVSGSGDVVDNADQRAA